jgi:hypothetical protein
MSTLQVGNLHFESTGNNRLQYSGSNGYSLVAGGTNVATINTTAVSFPLDLAVNAFSTNTFAVKTLSANGSNGTAGQALLSGGGAANAYWGVAGGNYVMQTFTSNTTWSKPENLKSIKVTVVGGGSGSQGVEIDPSPTLTRTGRGGSAGGVSIEYIPAPSIPGPVSVTVGLGGTAGAAVTPLADGVGGSGGTSSFGSFLSATGGAPVGLAEDGLSVGGLGSGGNLNFYGNPQALTAGPIAIGASNILSSVTPENANGFNYGAGAGGRVQPLAPAIGGFEGGPGVVIVEEFY